MTLQDTGNFRRRLAAFLDPTNPNLDQIEPYPSDMGGEVKPPIFSTMPYFGGGSMEPIGPYIPSDDDSKVVPLSPLGGYLGALVANRTPRGDSTPIYFDDHMKQYMPRPFGPQEFPEYMQARGGNPFSTDALDKQKQIRDYLDNDQKIKDLFRRKQSGKMKAESTPFAGDLFSA